MGWEAGLCRRSEILSDMKALMVLLQENRYADIPVLSFAVGDRLNKTPIGTLFFVLMRMLSSEFEISAEEAERLWTLIEPIDFSGLSFENENIFFSAYALVAGYLRKASSLIVANDVLDKYSQKNLHILEKPRPMQSWMSCFHGIRECKPRSTERIT